MNKKGKKSSSRIKSFGHAFHGIFVVFSTQINFRIQTVFALLAIFLGILFSISTIEWTIIILLIGLMLSLETINTSIEILSDKVENNYSESIKKVKDLSAAAVLISSIAAVSIGVIIFFPKIREMINSF